MVGSTWIVRFLWYESQVLGLTWDRQRRKHP